MDENSLTTNQNESEGGSTPSRWIGIILGGIFLYYAIDGGCSWWVWVIFGLLALLTYAGVSKIGQAILGLVLVFFCI